MPGETEVKSDYDAGGSTTTGAAHVVPAQEPTIEPAKYGTGKPKRVVIRARVTHGTENQG